MRNFLLFIVALLIVIAIAVMCVDDARAAGYASMTDGSETPLTLWYGAACDSARAWIAYDSTNRYENVKLLPIDADSLTLQSTTAPDPDSIGLNTVTIYVWERGWADSVRVDAYIDLISPATSAGEGSGPNALTVYTYDTTFSTLLPFVDITISTIGSGTDVAEGTTGPSGVGVFRIPSGAFEIQAWAAGYVFEVDTVNINDDAIDTVLAANGCASPPPTGGHLCSVWGYLWTPQEAPKAAARVTFSLPEQWRDTCNNVIMAPTSITTETNDSGRFSVPLLYSSCMINLETGEPVEWKVVATWDDASGVGRTKETSFSVTADSLTYYLVW